MTGIILAGGENSRMAMNKAFLKIKNEPIIERILSVFKGLFNEVIIVTNNPEFYVSYDVILVGDLIKKRGPMAGIYSGLLNSKNSHSFVAACDMPFLNRRLISYMIGSIEGSEIVIPRINGLSEPLHAIYSKSCLALIERHLKHDDSGLNALLEGSRVRYMDESEISTIDPEMKSFINVNTPFDLEKVKDKEE